MKEEKAFKSFLQRIDDLLEEYTKSPIFMPDARIQELRSVRSVFLLCLKELEKKRYLKDINGEFVDVVLLSDVKRFFGGE